MNQKEAMVKEAIVSLAKVRKYRLIKSVVYDCSVKTGLGEDEIQKIISKNGWHHLAGVKRRENALLVNNQKTGKFNHADLNKMWKA